MILFEIWDLVGFIKVENWDFDFDFGMIVVLTVILLVTQVYFLCVLVIV